MDTPVIPPVTNAKDKIVIYFLASSNPLDIEACKTVEKHLSQFVRNSKPHIEICTDYNIDAGMETEKYKEILYTADLVIAFGSADFIADQITVDRINKVIARYNNRQTRLLAIIVRNFMWKVPFFGQLNIFPKRQIPLYDQKTWSEDDAFATVAQELKDSIVKYYKVEQISIEIKPWDEE
jgi:hypothetical protein